MDEPNSRQEDRNDVAGRRIRVPGRDVPAHPGPGGPLGRSGRRADRHRRPARL